MKLDALFSSHMVLQRNKPIKLWGEGDGTVYVTLNGKTVTTDATDGKWLLSLEPQPAGGPYEIIFKDNSNEIVLCDVMIGDVWLAAGQSNMEMITFATKDGFETAKNYGDNSNIRFFTVPRRTKPNEHIYNWHFESIYSVDTDWEVCSEDRALHFSAIGFYFADILQREKNVPIGIISCNYGGTRIEAWTQRELLLQNKDILHNYNNAVNTLDIEKYEKAHNSYILKKEEFCKQYNAVEMVQRLGPHAFARTNEIKWPEDPPFGPYNPNWWGVLYENMLKRILPFSICGVLWYQGESNIQNAEQYFDLFLLLVSSWRTAWGDNLPFLTVKIAPFNRYPYEDSRERLVSQQIRASKEIDNVFIADTDDIGEADNIHPINKKTVAERLYKIADSTVYS